MATGERRGAADGDDGHGHAGGARGYVVIVGGRISEIKRNLGTLACQKGGLMLGMVWYGRGMAWYGMVWSNLEYVL